MIFKGMVSLLSCDPILLVKDFFKTFFDSCFQEENLHTFPIGQFGSVVVAAKVDLGYKKLADGVLPIRMFIDTFLQLIISR